MEWICRISHCAMGEVIVKAVGLIRCCAHTLHEADVKPASKVIRISRGVRAVSASVQCAGFGATIQIKLA